MMTTKGKVKIKGRGKAKIIVVFNKKEWTY